MESIQIRGLVRLARWAKRELSLPLSEERLLRLREQVKQGLAIVERTLREHGTGPEGLPPPSGRAYDLLRTLDACGYPHHNAAQLQGMPIGVLSFPDLRWEWMHVLRRMAFNRRTHDSASYADVLRLSEQIESCVTTAGPVSAWLDEETRGIRGWLRCFSRRERFEAYRATTIRARPLIGEAVRQYRPTEHFWISFQPVKAAFRLQKKKGLLQVMLPTPMLTFDDRGFELVARAAFAGGAPDELRTAMHAPEYQAMQVELDALSTEGLAESVTLVCARE